MFDPGSEMLKATDNVNTWMVYGWERNIKN